jgi:SAM-dependent methyltransferase
MSPLQALKPTKRLDWDAIYREGTPPWETGMPAAELVRMVEDKIIRPASTLELACGTGADAIYLAKRGFEMTAIDSSPTALERARGRAERDDALLRLVLADAFEFGQTAGQFEFVYDVGFYHYVRHTDLDRFLDLLWRVTKPGSYYFTVAARKGDTAVEGGPPPVTKRQIYHELGRLFELVQLQECRLGSPDSTGGYPAWSCLMQRPLLGSSTARS